MAEERISADIIRGHTDTIILKLLQGSDRYGYEIYRLILSGSDGQYELKEPTMYAALRRLEQDGNITSYWGDETQGGRRRYYKITEKGKIRFEENKRNWEFAKRILDNLI